MPATAQASPVSGKKFAIGALIVVAIIVVIAIAAGGRNGNSNRIKGSDLAMSQYEGFRSQICECEDSACQREVLERMDRFANTSGDEIKALSPEQNKRVEEIFSEIGRCVKEKASNK